jgi:hypothetical protein
MYLKAAQPCHRDFQKALQGIYTLEERSHETTTVTKQAARISDDDFDAHTEDYASDKERTTEKSLVLKARMKFIKPIPDGDFDYVQLDNNQVEATVGRCQKQLVRGDAPCTLGLHDNPTFHDIRNPI